MRKHYSLRHADKILDKLFGILGYSDDRADIIVQSWSNGREQGYYLQLFRTNIGICFAQQRNSDAMIVIHGNLMDFDITTNMPATREVWDRQKCFEDDDEAVAYIIDKLEIINEIVKEDSPLTHKSTVSVFKICEGE